MDVSPSGGMQERTLTLKRERLSSYDRSVYEVVPSGALNGTRRYYLRIAIGIQYGTVPYCQYFVGQAVSYDCNARRSHLITSAKCISCKAELLCVPVMLLRL